jgi:hypothetical protein
MTIYPPLPDNIFQLDSIRVQCEERIKAIARDRLRSLGMDDDPQEWLEALDLIWDLPGDRHLQLKDGKWFCPTTDEPAVSREIERYRGARVPHHRCIGTVVKMRDGGFGLRIRIKCAYCSKRVTVYARPGCQRGFFCYIYDRNGKFLADLRNRMVVCEGCR